MKKWIWLLILIPVLSLAQNKKAALEAQKKRLQQEIVQINALIKTSAKKRANVLTQVETRNTKKHSKSTSNLPTTLNYIHLLGKLSHLQKTPQVVSYKV